MSVRERDFITTPLDRNLFGLRPHLRDPVVYTDLPTTGPGARILLANTSRIGLRFRNAGLSDVFIGTDQADVITKGWILPPEKEISFPPPWAPIGELFAGAAGTPSNLRVWELHAE